MCLKVLMPEEMPQSPDHPSEEQETIESSQPNIKLLMLLNSSKKLRKAKLKMTTVRFYNLLGINTGKG